MSAAGTTIELALSALFELCVPGVSGGIFEQTFPASLVVPITDNERTEYGVGADAEAWRIQSDDGFILLWLEEGTFRITTGDGDPELAQRLFVARLADENAEVDHALTDTQAPRAVVARMPLSPTSFILIHFFGGVEFGFYGSAVAYTMGQTH